MSVATKSVGSALSRVDGHAKVTGQARYAFEEPVENVAYAAAVTATIAAGEIDAIDPERALALPGVLAVISHDNAPRLGETDDGELLLFQSDTVHYRGQIVAAVVAETLEAAREAAAAIRIDYAPRDHDVELHTDAPAPLQAGQGQPLVPHGHASRATRKQRCKTPRSRSTRPTPPPRSTTTRWSRTPRSRSGRAATSPSTTRSRARTAPAAPSPRSSTSNPSACASSPSTSAAASARRAPRGRSPCSPRSPRAMVERPVKVALTRQQMFASVGYRTPTIQRVRLGATTDGRLTAIAHDAFEQTSTVREFAEQTCVATRMMYAAPDRLTRHRLVALDVPTPSWMRAPGECPGMFALESAIDELAVATDIDPIELRIRNEPELDPEKGIPFSSRNLVACLREGAERFGWADRDPTPGARADGRWLIGSGVAASVYPVYRSPSKATARFEPDGSYTVEIAATDIGTGARTVLTQIAADTLGVDPEHLRLEIGDSDFGVASIAGGSMGTASWGTAVVRACEALLAQGEGEVSVHTGDEIKAQAELSRHAFGAQFVEVRVDADSGEVRLNRVLGVFAVGRVINPKTARSQFIGGMTQGLGMALQEESVMDRGFGDYLNHDLAQYHVPVNADIEDIEAVTIDEDDAELNPMGSKGIGEIGIVGTAAAVANAVFHATGRRVRELPIRLDRVLV